MTSFPDPSAFVTDPFCSSGTPRCRLMWDISRLQLHDITRKTCGWPGGRGVDIRGFSTAGPVVGPLGWGYVRIFNLAMHSLFNGNALRFKRVTSFSTDDRDHCYYDGLILIPSYLSSPAGLKPSMKNHPIRLRRAGITHLGREFGRVSDYLELHNHHVSLYDTASLTNERSVPREHGAKRWS